VPSATPSSAGMYTMADLETFRLSGAAKQCTEPNPLGVPTKIYIGDHRYVQIEEDVVPSSVSGDYVNVQSYIVYDGTQMYTWNIDPDTMKIDAVYRSAGSIPFPDTPPKDITCKDSPIDASIFVLPPGVKVTSVPGAKIADLPVAEQPSPQELQSVKNAQQTLNGAVLKAIVLFVQKVNASPRTDIPNLRAFVSNWGAAIASWNDLAQELNRASVDKLSPADLDALSARVNKIQSERAQILAAYNVLSQDEISILDSPRTN
jgi:hypothetical protein